MSFGTLVCTDEDVALVGWHSIEDIRGIEVTVDADNVKDGKPTFLLMGAHHAREWPSAEHTIEFAFDLLQSYEAGDARARCSGSPPSRSTAPRPSRHVAGDRWFVDETYLTVAGWWVYLYRAIDQHGQVIGVLASQKRDLAAIRRFFARH